MLATPPRPPQLPPVLSPAQLVPPRPRSNTALIVSLVVGGLLVIFGIGVAVVAAIAIPNIERINAAAQEAQAMRNAEGLASVAAAASAAGIDFVTMGGNDLIVTLHAVRGGATVEQKGSPFEGTYFGIPHLTDNEIRAAAKHLTVVDGQLVMASVAPHLQRARGRANMPTAAE